jgi:hypothetical protein
MGGCAGLVVIPQNVNPKTGSKRTFTQTHDSAQTKKTSKKNLTLYF